MALQGHNELNHEQKINFDASCVTLLYHHLCYFMFCESCNLYNLGVRANKYHSPWGILDVFKNMLDNKCPAHDGYMMHSAEFNTVMAPFTQIAAVSRHSVHHRYSEKTDRDNNLPNSRNRKIRIQTFCQHPWSCQWLSLRQSSTYLVIMSQSF